MTPVEQAHAVLIISAIALGVMALILLSYWRGWRGKQ